MTPAPDPQVECLLPIILWRIEKFPDPPTSIPEAACVLLMHDSLTGTHLLYATGVLAVRRLHPRVAIAVPTSAMGTVARIIHGSPYWDEGTHFRTSDGTRVS